MTAQSQSGVCPRSCDKGGSVALLKAAVRDGSRTGGDAAPHARGGWRAWLADDERGDTVMLEAAIVYPLTLFMLFAVMATFSLMYQRWNLQVIAAEAATRVGQVYKYIPIIDLDHIVTGEYEPADAVKINPYRSYQTVQLQMASAASDLLRDYIYEDDNSRLKRTTFALERNVDVSNVGVVSDGNMRRHVFVEIKASYSVPFDLALVTLGLPRTPEMVVRAQADCVDLSDYVTTTRFLNATADSVGRISELVDDETALQNVGTHANALLRQMSRAYEPLTSLV